VASSGSAAAQRKVSRPITPQDTSHLGVACARYGEREPGHFDAIMERFPALLSRVGVRAGLLSGGEQQMLVIGRALMAAPRLLLFDEPSLGLAPIIIQAVFSVLRDIKEEGVTMLLVKQNVREGLGLADRAYVLESGRIVKEGTGEALLGDNEIQTTYLSGDS